MAVLGVSLLNRMRINASRLNYYIPNVYLTIAGTRRETVTIRGSIEITKARGPDGSRATLRVKSSITPAVGQVVVIGVGSLGNRLFGGVIQRIDEVAIDHVVAFYDLTCVGYRWMLDRRLVFGNYSNQSITTIITTLISSYASVFTTAHVQGGLATATDLVFRGETVGEALDRLKSLVSGADWYVDDYQDLHFFTGTETLVQPATVTENNFDRAIGITRQSDYSQARTRVYVKAPGSAAVVDTVIGSTTLWLEDSSRFSSTGGSAITEDAQILTYTAARAGKSSAVTARPDPTVTPTLSITAGTSSHSTGTWQVKISFVYADGSESLPSSASNQVTLGATDRFTTTLELGPSGVTQRRVYINYNGGGYGAYDLVNDNTSATYTCADGLPFGNVVGSPLAAAQTYTRGHTRVYVADTAQFESAGGLAQTRTAHATYTGLSTTSGAGALTGIPASGDGSLDGTFAIGDTLQNYNPDRIPALTGIPASSTGSIVRMIRQGTAVDVWVQRDDTSAQTALAALEGGDGIREHLLELNDRTGVTDLATAGDADLARFGASLVEYTFGSRDDHFVPGCAVTINISSPTAISDTTRAQEVTIEELGTTTQRYPLRRIHAAGTRYTLTDVLRQSTRGS